MGTVMAGFIPAIHALSPENAFADALDKPGRGEFVDTAHFIFAIACSAAM